MDVINDNLEFTKLKENAVVLFNYVVFLLKRKKINEASEKFSKFLQIFEKLLH